MFLKTNTLQVCTNLLEYEIDGTQSTCELTEFVIDGKPLSKLLGIDRDLRTSQCDLDGATINELPSKAERMINELCNSAEPLNQFGTRRTVLYRCHCGSDYCGVVSCQVVALRQSVEWRDISFEDDQGPHRIGADCGYPNLNPIELLTFDKFAYLQAIRRFSQGQK